MRAARGLLVALLFGLVFWAWLALVVYGVARLLFG
jgi:hypothetical protein